VACFTDKKIEKLLGDPGIVRKRRKVTSVVRNAQAFLAIQKEIGSFDAFIWSFVGGQPVKNTWQSLTEVPARTEHSDALSKDVKRRGFIFVRSTFCSVLMQATGLVNDHLVERFRFPGVGGDTKAIQDRVRRRNRRRSGSLRPRLCSGEVNPRSP
jgi:DNA-3-methyladenine glycosylase I